ncbi:MAG: hypothetical protein ABJC19_10770 [Gemmatimonadota bacterium]
MRTRPLSLITLALALLLGCGGGPTGSNGTTDNGNVLPPPGGVAQFSVEPMVTPGTLTSLGNLGPPGHVLPTNHVYFYGVDFTNPPSPPDQTVRPVYAPATGTVAYLLQPSGTDWKIGFRATSTFYYYLDHVVLTTTLKVGDIVHAGDQIGTSNPGGSIDLGAYDLSVTLPGFANPARYGPETLHCVSPWLYFTEPLRSAHYARIRRAATAPDKDGHIDLDVPGTLAGNWYEEGLALDQTEGPSGWPRTVAFVTDYYDPSKVRVSIGGTIATPGIWTIPDDAPRPAAVTSPSGVVAYRLVYTESTNVQSGLMLVQLTDATHLKIEVFEGSQAASASFDGNARSYVR